MKKIMTKITAAVLAAVSAAALLSSCASSTPEKLKYEIAENGGIHITGYTDVTTRTEITVPDEIDGVPVTEICDFALFNADSLQKITVGKNVKVIGEWAFTNNKGLREFAVDPENEYFTVKDGVLFTKDMKTLLAYPPARNIEFDKFAQSLNTTTYEIPDGVETVRGKAFYKCGCVTEIKIPDSVKRIEEKAFFKVEALESLTLSKSLEYIGKDAFAYCAKVKTVDIPSGVAEIGEYAFYNCTSLLNITVERAEGSVTVGKKWYPTMNGKEIKELKITWSENAS